MMKRTFFALLCAIASTHLRASPSILDERELGPHGVGFRVMERYDKSRSFRFPTDLQGRPRKGHVARPIQISVWYPAPKNGPRMKLRDYAMLMATEQDFEVPAPGREEAMQRALAGFDILRTASPEQRRKLLDLETSAVRDAPAAPGRFPVILWTLGSPAISQGNAELLASHGYVIVSAPRIPPTRGLADTISARTDYENKSRDIALLIEAMADFSSADIRRLGAVGFSAGGRWALAEAMRNSSVRAVASLESIILFDDDGGQFRSMPFVQPERMRVPVTHLVRREWVSRETSKLWEEMRYSDRSSYVFEDARLDHLDFVSIGYASILAGLRPELAEPVSATFRFINRLLRTFFDAHVAGDRRAADALPVVAEASGLPAGFVTASRSAAAAAPLADDQIQDALTDDLAGTLRLVRTRWKESGKPPVAEPTLNLAGYVLLATNRVPEAVDVLLLNAEMFSESANVYDSLSDAYLRAGDEGRALELAEKTITLLEKDGSPAERKELIRRSAQEKIARLKKN